VEVDSDVVTRSGTVNDYLERDGGRKRRRIASREYWTSSTRLTCARQVLSAAADLTSQNLPADLALDASQSALLGSTIRRSRLGWPIRRCFQAPTLPTPLLPTPSDRRRGAVLSQRYAFAAASGSAEAKSVP
jgi:hypothetical protein